MKLSKKQKKNLKLLRDGILGIDPELFDMEVYRTTDNNRITKPLIKNKENDENLCGTIGCALGWSPFIKGLEPDDTCFYTFSFLEEGKIKYIDKLVWSIYFRYLFDERLNLFKGIYAWLFHDKWSWLDNTPEGVSIRANYLLEKEKIPLEIKYLDKEEYEKWKKQYIEKGVNNE